MNQSANVRSVEAIERFKIAMVTFADDARNALTGVDMEIRRVRDWLVREQAMYWSTQVKKRTEQVAMARTELHRRRLSQQNSDAISDTEQKENLRLAQRRLEEAEDKVAKVKKWIPILEHAISEYNATSQPLGDRLTGQFENSLALIERTIQAIYDYASFAPPSAPVLPPTSTSGPADSAPARSPAATQGGSQVDAVAQTETEAEPEPEPEPADQEPSGVPTP
jgi:hypothetical protein